MNSVVGGEIVYPVREVYYLSDTLVMPFVFNDRDPVIKYDNVMDMYDIRSPNFVARLYSIIDGKEVKGKVDITSFSVSKEEARSLGVVNKFDTHLM